MQIKKRYIFLMLPFFILTLSGLSTKVAQAVCPVCTVAVACALGLSRWLKIDDSVTGLWIGGLLVSTSIWTIQYLRKKKWTFKGMPIATFIFYYLTVILSLHWTKMLGITTNCFWGMDKLLWGMIVGSILFLAGVAFSSYLKKKNNDKVYFPFQKVVMPIIPLLIMSLVFYLITK